MLAAGVKADESGAFVTVLPLVKIRRMTYAMHYLGTGCCLMLRWGGAA